MSSRWYFLLCLLSLPPSLVLAQPSRDFRIQGKSIPELRREAGDRSDEPLLHFSNWFLLQKTTIQRRSATGWQAQTSTSRPFQIKELAFFCRIEFKLEKKVRFPVKVRLGEVQYVEQLEGKY